MEWLWYREHRSGLKVPTDVRYKPDRGNRLIGFSYEQLEQMEEEGEEAGLDVGQIDTMTILWKIYDRGQIVDRLNVLCPGHRFTKRSLKIPMLILWLQNEDTTKNPEIIRKIRSYPIARLDKMPTKKKNDDEDESTDST